MSQILIFAQNLTTLLLPVVLLLFLGLLFFCIKLLMTINKTAEAVKETTFMVNSVVNSSLFTVTSFIAGLFEGKGR